MVSTWSGLRRETPLTYSHPPLAAMTDTNIVQQLQNHIAEMERHHEKELTKLKANHDYLKACVRDPHDDEQSAHTLAKRTQGKSHPRRTCFVECKLCVDIYLSIALWRETYPWGWKPLNLKWYDGTTDPDEHLDVFLT